MTYRKLLYFAVYPGLILIAVLLFLISLYLLKPLNIPSDNYLLNVNKGDSVYKLANKLADDKIIRYPRLLRAYTFFTGTDNNIQAGEYELTPNLRTHNLINKLTRGDVKQYDITIIEGDNISTLIFKFKQAKSLNHILTKDIKKSDKVHSSILNNLKQYISNNNNNKYIVDVSVLENAEGILFPDTYYYTNGSSDQDLVNRAFVKLNNELKVLWESRSDKENKIIDSPYKALILASILEKEASDSSERSLVSGVMYNRLNHNMPLQVDPTVIYAIGNDFNGNLKKADLSINSKYNTYKNKGLPPTPISFPSANSIEAALNPVKHDLLYFVSMGNGKHYFSSTLEKHNDAVEKYQRNLINDKKNKLNNSESKPEKSKNKSKTDS